MHMHKMEISRGLEPYEQYRLLHWKALFLGMFIRPLPRKVTKKLMMQTMIWASELFSCRTSSVYILFLKIIYFIIWAWVFLPPHLCEGIGSCRTVVPDRRERSCGCRELNSDPLEGQSEPPLQPLYFKRLRLSALFAKLIWQIFL